MIGEIDTILFLSVKKIVCTNMCKVFCVIHAQKRPGCCHGKDVHEKDAALIRSVICLQGRVEALLSRMYPGELRRL